MKLMMSLCAVVAITITPITVNGWGQQWDPWSSGPKQSSPFGSPGPRVGGDIGGSTGGSQSQSSQCCNQFFKGPGKRCFDLTKCNGGGGFGGFDGGRDGGDNGFGFGSFGFGNLPQQPNFGPWRRRRSPDFAEQGMCTCMAPAQFGFGGGQKLGSVCCTVHGPGGEHGGGEYEPKKTTTGGGGDYEHEPPVTSPPQHRPKPTTTLVLKKAPEETPAADKNSASVQTLQWNPSLKSAVLSHRNLGLLPSLDTCGQGKILALAKGYVVGGVDADLGNHPWMALIGMAELGVTNPEIAFGCGGALINSRYVLTAAHCTEPSALKSQGYKVAQVRIGEFDQGKDPDCISPDNCAAKVQDIDVEEVFTHKDYNKGGTNENDITLIRLAKPVEFGRNVAPICLPVYDFASKQKEGDGPDQLTVAGWGLTKWTLEQGVKGADVLQEVKVPLASHVECQKYFKDINWVVGDGRFCSGGEHKKDSCRGDSGGPITGRVALKTERGVQTRTVQLGVVSLGQSKAECSEAGQGHLTLYTKVSHYLPWILDHMKP